MLVVLVVLVVNVRVVLVIVIVVIKMVVVIVVINDVVVVIAVINVACKRSLLLSSVTSFIFTTVYVLYGYHIFGYKEPTVAIVFVIISVIVFVVINVAVVIVVVNVVAVVVVVINVIIFVAVNLDVVVVIVIITVVIKGPRESRKIYENWEITEKFEVNPDYVLRNWKFWFFGNREPKSVM